MSSTATTLRQRTAVVGQPAALERVAIPQWVHGICSVETPELVRRGALDVYGD